VKAGYWLSDVSQPGRGNLKLVPGSHTVNRIDGAPRRDVPWPEPPGAAQVTARPGDVVLFDRRVWHARSVNGSNLTRKAVFFAYTYRWVRIRDRFPPAALARLPVRRQLLGLLDIDAADGDHAWGRPCHGAAVPTGTQRRRRSVRAAQLCPSRRAGIRAGDASQHTLGEEPLTTEEVHGSPVRCASRAQGREGASLAERPHITGSSEMSGV
jgi:hypothetical protein